jgi:hypothetical protein
MAGKYSSYRKNLERMAEDIGKDLLPFISKDEMLKHITPEDFVRILTPEERKKLKQLLEEQEVERNQR